MFRLLPNEEFKEIELKFPMKKRYAVSNKGRLMSFMESFEDGQLIKGTTSDGYRVFKRRRTPEERAELKFKTESFFVYRLVAEYFIPKTSEDQVHVLHLDYVRDNDDVRNLRWATYEEKMNHYNSNPKVIEGRRKTVESKIKSDGAKLTSTQVMLIKKMLKNPKGKTRGKMIAKQFGISQTHLKRIERGENWGHIKV
ncbi:MAG: NUMOD4 domain-containing protein [Flavobacteriaceae bacterium]